MWLLLLVLLAPAERLHTGFRFTEGPAADAEGRVHFNDIPNQKLYRVEKDGSLKILREKTNRANGLFFHGNGEVYACEGGAGAVVAYGKDGSRRVIADKYEGKRFNAPNDLVIDKAGGVYFTDPFFGVVRGRVPQEVFGVYYVTTGGKVTRLYSNGNKPNGIILSPDEKTLYVVCSGQATVVSFAVEAPGKVGKPRDFFALKQPEGRKNTGGDGLTVDSKGSLYITSWLGVQVVSAEGKLVKVLEFPEKPSNCCFSGNVLYVTARTSVYTMKLEAKGHVFPAGK